MPHFRNVSRTICQQVIAAGDQSGGFAACASLAASLTDLALEDLRRELGRLESWPAIARVRVWQVHDTEATAATDEAALRPEADTTIGAALIVEAADESAAGCLTGLLNAAGSPELLGDVAIYRIICHIDGDEVRRAHGG
jgi:hypothetical protein